MKGVNNLKMWQFENLKSRLIKTNLQIISFPNYQIDKKYLRLSLQKK